MVADFGLAEKIPDIRWVTLMGAGVTEGTEAKGKTPVSSSEARTWSQPNLSSLNSVNFGVPILGEEKFPMVRPPIAPTSGKLIFHTILPHSTGGEKLAVVGSPFWMAPEVLRDEPYNEKVSLGKVSLGTPRPDSL